MIKEKGVRMKPCNTPKSKFISFLFLFVTALGISQSAFALSPPWYRLQALLKTTLEKDPCVKVDKLTGEGLNMEVLVNVCNYNKAQALAALISKKHSYGPRLTLAIKVAYNNSVVSGSAPTNTTEALNLISESFAGNELFVKVIQTQNTPIGFVEFKPQIVQYYSDDISDWYRNTNLVAADAFKGILEVDSWRKAGIFVNPTTAKILASSLESNQ